LEEALIAFKEAEVAAKSCANFIILPKAAKREINAYFITQRVIMKQFKDKVLSHANFT
jgi:hypothetical protein